MIPTLKQLLLEMAHHPWGFWVSKEGNVYPVEDWGDHAIVACDLLVKLGSKPSVQASYDLMQKYGFAHIAGMNRSTISIDTMPEVKWEVLPRLQRRALEDIAMKYGKQIELNNKPVELFDTA